MANLPDLVNVDYFSDIGDGVARASTKAAAREAIGADRGIVDLRDWDAIRDGQWQNTLGAAYSTGVATMTNSVTPFTSADVGKVVIVNENQSPAPYFKRWTATILDVDGGVATLDTVAPSNAGNQRVRWGFDITDALNDALSDIQSVTPREAYLPGYYMASQIVVPNGVILRGAGWGYSYNAIYSTPPGLMNTFIGQLPGSEKNFLVFGGAAGTGCGPVGVINMILQGPDVNVRDMRPTIGSGLALRMSNGNPLIAYDGVELRFVHCTGFPEHGFEFPAGAVPLTVDNCRAFYNGGVGFEYGSEPLPASDVQTQVLHFQNCTGDGNVEALVRINNTSPENTIVITSLKSEGVPEATYATNTDYYRFEGWEGLPTGDAQAKAVVLNNCDQTSVVINGLSHISGGLVVEPGPCISIESDTDLVPNVVFNGVTMRVSGVPVDGGRDDAVTLRDTVNNVDIPRTVTSGVYPLSASNIGSSVETVTEDSIIGYFTDHTVFLDGGTPGLPPIAHKRAGAKCRFVNVEAADGDVWINGGGVVAMLHGDDQADTSTTITDSSPLAANWTVSGTCQIDTAIYKYGGGSIQISGTPGYIKPSASETNFTFGTDDFTIEAWIYPLFDTGAQCIFDFRPDSTNGDYLTLLWNSGAAPGTFSLQVNNAVVISGGTMTAEIWHHIAVCRSGTRTKLFINGAQVGSSLYDTTDYLCAAGRPYFGVTSYNESGAFAGRMDDIRIVTGAALYPSDFTVPAGVLPSPRKVTLPLEGSISVISDGTNWRTF